MALEKRKITLGKTQTESTQLQELAAGGSKGILLRKWKGRTWRCAPALTHQLTYTRTRDTLTSPEFLGEDSYLEGLRALSYEDKKRL